MKATLLSKRTTWPGYPTKRLILTRDPNESSFFHIRSGSNTTSHLRSTIVLYSRLCHRYLLKGVFFLSHSFRFEHYVSLTLDYCSLFSFVSQVRTLRLTYARLLFSILVCVTGSLYSFPSAIPLSFPVFFGFTHFTGRRDLLYPL
jgi:hypothetical protein